MVPAGWARRHARERLGLEADEMDGGHYVTLSRPRELAGRLDAVLLTRFTWVPKEPDPPCVAAADGRRGLVGGLHGRMLHQLVQVADRDIGFGVLAGRGAGAVLEWAVDEGGAQAGLARAREVPRVRGDEHYFGRLAAEQARGRPVGLGGGLVDPRELGREQAVEAQVAVAGEVDEQGQMAVGE